MFFGMIRQRLEKVLKPKNKASLSEKDAIAVVKIAKIIEEEEFVLK